MSNQLSAETQRLIEENRRKAIERRNQMQANRNAVNQNRPAAPLPVASTSCSPHKTMTAIKPREHIGGQVANKKARSDDNVSRVAKAPKVQVKGSMRLISCKRFSLDIGYNDKVNEVLRRVPSRDWNPSTKQWSFDLKDYKKLLSDLRNLSEIEFQFSDTIPERIINALLEARNKPKEDIDLSSKLGPKLMDKLYDFQTEGIIFGIRTGGRCLIADDMGLGKTIQSIGIAQWYRQDWPLLVVCPSSLRLQWRDSLIEYLPNISSESILIVEKVNQTLPKIPITIISYDLTARMRSQFSLDYKQVYNFVILDESHYIKTDSAARTEAVHLLAKSSKRVILLTGTPALSRPMELFPQIKLIDPKLFTSKHEFGVRYCDAQLKNFWARGGKGAQRHVWDYKGAKNLDELKIILEATLLVRRLKTDVLQELTKKKREMILLDIKHIDEKRKNKLQFYSKMIKKVHFKPQSDENTSLFEWYQESAMAKVEPVCEYLQQLLNKEIKLLCFCHHKQMMDSIEEVLATLMINHIRIDGSTPSAHRQEACKEFQRQDDCRVALLSITACATGLNLTAASTVVFAELFWNPGILSQAEDRVHRIGQKSDVKIYYLVARNTIDDMIWPMISKKLEILNKAGLSKDNFQEATTALDSVQAQQHLISEFFQSLDENERKSLMEDIDLDDS